MAPAKRRPLRLLGHVAFYQGRKAGRSGVGHTRTFPGWLGRLAGWWRQRHHGATGAMRLLDNWRDHNFCGHFFNLIDGGGLPRRFHFWFRLDWLGTLHWNGPFFE